MILSRQAVYDLARAAGFPPAEARMAVAVAILESSLNTEAHNPKPPDDSYGLMQINLYGSLGPERRAWWNLTSDRDLWNPVTNMRAAFDLWHGGGWRHWSTATAARALEPTLPAFDEDLGGGAGEPALPSVPLVEAAGITETVLRPMRSLLPGVPDTVLLIGAGVASALLLSILLD